MLISIPLFVHLQNIFSTIPYLQDSFVSNFTIKISAVMEIWFLITMFFIKNQVNILKKSRKELLNRKKESWKPLPYNFKCNFSSSDLQHILYVLDFMHLMSDHHCLSLHLVPLLLFNRFLLHYSVMSFRSGLGLNQQC